MDTVSSIALTCLIAAMNFLILREFWIKWDSFTRSVKLRGDETKGKASPIMSLLELFCHIDDFCQEFEPILGRRQKAPQTSEH